jgi:hypothetical protein
MSNVHARGSRSGVSDGEISFRDQIGTATRQRGNAELIRNMCPHRRNLDFAFDQLLPIYGSMQIPQSKDTSAKVIGYFARHKRKANDSGQAIEEATADSSEKIAVIEELLRELPSIVEQNGRLSDVLIEMRSTSIVRNKTSSLSWRFGRTSFSVDNIFCSADRTIYFHLLGKYDI